MKVEMDQMKDTGTLEAMKLSMQEPGATIINSTMVLVQKPDKKKARLCACGNELKGKIADLFSPTIGALTYSTVHQIAVIDRMKVRIIETVGAYLYQFYPESSSPIYIRIPAKVMSALQIPEDTVYPIKKYMVCLLTILLMQSFFKMQDTTKRRAIHACSTKSLELNVFTYGFMLMIPLS